MKTKTRDRIQQEIAATYVPLKELIFEDNKKEINIITHFTDYSHVLARVELMIHRFVVANPSTKDIEILSALKRIKEDPLREFSQSDEEALAFTISYGMSTGLQEKRLAINEVRALLDWLIYEVEGRMQKKESYIEWLNDFFKDDPIKAARGDNK